MQASDGLLSKAIIASAQVSGEAGQAPAANADDFDQRFEGRLSEDGTTIESSCYLVEGGEWIHDFDVVYTRV